MAPATSKQIEQLTSSLAEIAADRQREFEFPLNVKHSNNKAASQTSNDSHEGQTALRVDVDGDGDGSVELVRLREANVRLEAEVSRLRDKSDRLEGERRRLSARLAAVHTAMQQLEREAAIRSRTRAEATMGVQQKVCGVLWGSMG
ncbi:unnamed protein product, partial [Closterium sp. NIES-54]